MVHDLKGEQVLRLLFTYRGWGQNLCLCQVNKGQAMSRNRATHIHSSREQRMTNVFENERGFCFSKLKKAVGAFGVTLIPMKSL